jgi:uncharacterized protein YcfJ
MQTMLKPVLTAAVLLALAGCADVPTAPTIAVMPAPGMPFAVFQQDDANCQQYAQAQIGANAKHEANSQVATGAIAGTVIGAAAGALLGGGRNGAQGGAATGLLFGTAVGAGNAQDAGMSMQRRYNIAYAQCMYADGNQVPGYAAPSATPLPPPPTSTSSAPTSDSPPPPPPGSPPPPPPL